MKAFKEFIASQPRMSGPDLIRAFKSKSVDDTLDLISSCMNELNDNKKAILIGSHVLLKAELITRKIGDIDIIFRGHLEGKEFISNLVALGCIFLEGVGESLIEDGSMVCSRFDTPKGIPIEVFWHTDQLNDSFDNLFDDSDVFVSKSLGEVRNLKIAPVEHVIYEKLKVRNERIKHIHDLDEIFKNLVSKVWQYEHLPKLNKNEK